MDKDERILQLLTSLGRDFFFGEDSVLWQNPSAANAEFWITLFGASALY